ncbi:hypothetical protein [Thermomonospora echinospora]|uniref:hypothetical protein n=1 Tax=Thermomonospora echinospora TaxID=1992 RepID=UPI00135A1173|nr:hypothetical protein [Thermomonospora echinospora]
MVEPISPLLAVAGGAGSGKTAIACRLADLILEGTQPIDVQAKRVRLLLEQTWQEPRPAGPAGRPARR